MHVGIARQQAARALVVEHRPADVPGAEPRVAEVEVEIAALPPGGDDALVLGRGFGPALVAVEGVRAEEDRVRALGRGDGVGDAGERDQEQRRGGE